jgi:ABC-type branched-subunit amino acid transport system permease subunit
MTDLQVSFLFETAVGFLVIASISNVALGKARLWVVGQAAFLGTGGVYAWAAGAWPWPAALAVTAGLFLVATGVLSLAAALLKGDRFVVVSLAAAYSAYSVGVSLFGEGVRDLPAPRSSEGALAILALALAACLGFGLYVWGLARSDLDTVLVVARDEHMVLKSGRLDPRPIAFWVHFVSTVPVGVGGVLAAAFYGAYSPNTHAVSRCLLFFVMAFLFGTTSVLGSVAAALLLSTLGRAVDLVLSSPGVDAAYVALQSWLGSGTAAETASNIAAPLTEGLLAVVFIVLIRLKPEGVFGTVTSWIRR